MKKIRLLSGSIATFLSLNVYAGGYQLQEYSITNLGRAFAGAGVAGDDYSAIAFNPASINLKDTGFQIGASEVVINVESKGKIIPSSPIFTDTAKEDAKIRQYLTVPHFFAQKKLNNNFHIGFGFYIPYGLGYKYNSDWYGRTHALETKIETFDLALAGSYKITDKLSFGLSAIAERYDARLTNFVELVNSESVIEGNDWTNLWNTGLTYRFNDKSTFGVAYRSKAIFDLKGKHRFEGGMFDGFKGKVSAKIVLPEHILASYSQNIGKFTLSTSARWTRWSRFKTLAINSNIANITPVNENWGNTWTISGGIDYKINQNWIIRTGLAYDEAGVKDSQHRTARIPDVDRWMASAGFTYLKNNYQLDFGYTHMFLDTTRANHNDGKSQLDAKYDMSLVLFGAQFQYHF